MKWLVDEMKVDEMISRRNNYLMKRLVDEMKVVDEVTCR
jgi:hypothetical protein